MILARAKREEKKEHSTSKNISIYIKHALRRQVT